MAEAFARAFGDDVLIARSAGLLPSESVSKSSGRVMLERNVPIGTRAPRLVSYYDLAEFDLVVNMTGRPLTFADAGAVVEWEVADPARMPLSSHRAVRDRIEALVSNLVANLRFREGFAPRRDRAQSDGARAAFRIVLLAALLAGPWCSTPLDEKPAGDTGARAAGANARDSLGG
jgi:protein-tyrosine-phosphatase